MPLVPASRVDTQVILRSDRVGQARESGTGTRAGLPVDALNVEWAGFPGYVEFLSVAERGTCGQHVGKRLTAIFFTSVHIPAQRILRRRIKAA